MLNQEIVSQTLSKLKVAIVHEWFVNYAGSERVVEQLLTIFPQAEVFALVDFLPENQRFYLQGKRPHTSFIQKLPFAKKSFRNYFPLFPMAVEAYDLRGFDVVISSTHLTAKGVIINQNQLHIAYCHSPCRFAWDLYHQYLEEAGLLRGIKGFLAQHFLSRLRIWDQISNHRVHSFVANSQYIRKRIAHVYQREAAVVYPPVDTASFSPDGATQGNYYFAASRLVPYKKMDLIAEAFGQMPDKKLIIVGSGTEEDKIRKLVKPNIEWRKEADASDFKNLMAGCKAFVFAAEEDFGITLAEAQAAGKPVVAFQRGGAAEIVAHHQTGILFPEQTAASIIEAIQHFEKQGIECDPKAISERAQVFSVKQFRQQMAQHVYEKWEEFCR